VGLHQGVRGSKKIWALSKSVLRGKAQGPILLGVSGLSPLIREGSPKCGIGGKDGVGRRQKTGCARDAAGDENQGPGVGRGGGDIGT